MPHCHSHRFRAMGSPCAVHLYCDTATEFNQVAQQVVAEVLRLENRYSRYRNDSITAAINAAGANGSAITTDTETAALLDYAATAWQQSDGLFDITSGLLRKAWDFRAAILPQQRLIDSLLPRIGWHKLRWQNPQLEFPVAGMELDFGGYVKEYAADCAAAVARRNGIQHGLVDLGGDIRVLGPHPDGRPWSIGIHHPRIPDQVWACIEIHAGAIASSGDYERCIIHNGKRYGHILNPKTGWPVDALVAVSVMADHCLLAGSATTITLLRGRDGLAWLSELGLPWLAMDSAGKVYGTLIDSVSCAP